MGAITLVYSAGRASNPTTKGGSVSSEPALCSTPQFPYPILHPVLCTSYYIYASFKAGVFDRNRRHGQTEIDNRNLNPFLERQPEVKKAWRSIATRRL